MDPASYCTMRARRMDGHELRQPEEATNNCGDPPALRRRWRLIRSVAFLSRLLDEANVDVWFAESLGTSKG